VCVIKVGAHSETAVKELKARMEDALFATKASIDEGIVPGGGASYLHAAQMSYVALSAEPQPEDADNPPHPPLPVGDTEIAGFKLVLAACEEPMRLIVSNGGKNGDVWVERVKAENDPELGVDATDMEIKCMLEAGILDPLKVARCAVANAVSVAGILLTTEAAIVKGRPAKPGDL
jgi:chaperonin GroEL